MGRIKVKRRLYSIEDLQQALNDIQSGKISIGKASTRYGIPKSTLGHMKLRPCPTTFKKIGRHFIMSSKQELELAEYMRWMADKLQLPFTYELLITHAHSMMQKVNRHIEKPSKRWAARYAKRQGFSARKARHTEASRSVAESTPEKVIEYFELLKCEVEKLEVNTTCDIEKRIWNMDEKGWSKQQALQQPVLVPRGSKQAHAKRIFTADHITSLHCVNAAGEVLPSTLVVFKNNLPRDLDYTTLPPRWMYTSTDSGFVNNEEFLIWFRDIFVKNIGRERPQLLVYDAASCHCSAELAQYALDQGISIVSLPGKTTAFLQPLDQIFSNLIQKFSQQAYRMAFSKLDFLARPSNFPAILATSMKQAWPAEIIVNSFKRTGMYPPNMSEVAYRFKGDALAKIMAVLEPPPSATHDTDSEAGESESVETVDLDTSTEHGVEACGHCGRPQNDPCQTCLTRWRKETNVLFRAGIITEENLDILDPPAIPPRKGVSRLTGAKHITGQEIIDDLNRKIKEKEEKEEKQKQRLKEKQEKEERQKQKKKKSTHNKDQVDADEADELPDILPPKRKRRGKTAEPVEHEELEVSSSNPHVEPELSCSNPPVESDLSSSNPPKAKRNRKQKTPATSSVSTPTTSTTPSTSNRFNRTVKKINYAHMHDGIEIEENQQIEQSEKAQDQQTDFCMECEGGENDDDNDSQSGIKWIGCDICPKWWHYHCLSTEFQTDADLSLLSDLVQFRCPHCPVKKICVVCFVEGSDESHDMATCDNCPQVYHLDCLPEAQYIECKTYRASGNKWYCSRCHFES